MAVKAEHAEGKFAARNVTVASEVFYTHPAQHIPRFVIACQKEGARAKAETARVQSRASWEGGEANAKGLTKDPVINFLAVCQDKATRFRQRLISAWLRRSLSRLFV